VAKQNRKPKSNPIKLGIKIGGLKLKNPMIAASGTFGYGTELERFMDPGLLGGIVGKTVTLAPRKGNTPPRTCETPSGMLNCIGLQNDGIDGFLEKQLPGLAATGAAVIVSIAGKNAKEYAALGAMLEKVREVDAVEINLSCPNVSKGMDFSVKPAATRRVVSLVREKLTKPLIAKLSPNVTDIQPIAKAAQAGGADAICLINTLLGMAVDWRNNTPRISRVMGGLSGPAIRPVAVRMVYQAAKVLEIPVVAVGGAACAEDVLEFMRVGATAVQVGTATFVDPAACAKIVQELPALLREIGVKNIQRIIGSFRE